jgi:UDP-glucose 4-epimerase
VLGFETFNLGTGIGFSVLQVIDTYEKVCGKKIPYKILGRRPGDIASCYAAADKAKQILQWNAKRSLFEMCSSSWAFQGQLKNPYPTPFNG